MNNSAAGGRAPLGLIPGQPTPKGSPDHVLHRGGRSVRSPPDRLRKPVSSETRGIKATGLVGIAPRRQSEE